MTHPHPFIPHVLALILLALPVVSTAAADAPKPEPRADAHGDALPPGAIARLGTVRYRHTEIVRDAQYAPNGQLLATICYGKDIRLWNAKTGAFQHQLEKIPAYCQQGAYSPDSQWFAVGGLKAVQMWSTQTGEPVRTFKNANGSRERHNAVAFFPDGQRIAATGSFGHVYVWQADTGKQLNRLEVELKDAFEDPAGDEPQGQRKARPQQVRLAGLAVSPDGSMIVTGAPDERIHRWGATTGKPLSPIDVGTNAVRLHFIPNTNRLVVLTDDAEVRLYDLADEPKLIRTHEVPVAASDIAVSANGRVIAAVQMDGQMLGWDTATGEPLFDTRHPDEAREDLKKLLNREMAVNLDNLSFYAIDLSPDGKTAAASGGPFGRIGAHCPVFVNTANGQRVRPFEAHTWRITGIGYTPNAKRIITTDNAGEQRTWDTNTGEALAMRPAKLDRPRPAAISKDHLLVARLTENVVSVVEADTGKRRFATTLQTELIHSAVFSPDGRMVAVSAAKHSKIPNGRDYKTVVLDTKEGNILHTFTGFHGYYQAVAFSPDGKHIAVSGQSPERGINRAVYVYDLTEPRPEPRVLDDHPGDGVFAMAYSPRGRFLAVSYDTGKVRVWNARTSRIHQELEGAGNRVNGLDFSHDGSLVASADWNGRVCVWDTASGERKSVLDAKRGPLDVVAFSPDGRTLAAGGWDTTVLVWDIRDLGGARGFSWLDQPSRLAAAHP